MLNTKIKMNTLLFSMVTLLSGFCGIFFETLSNKVFSYLFGVTLVSTTVTVTVFFIGLALGSYLFSILVKKSKSVVFHYLCIESILVIFLFLYPTFYTVGFNLLDKGIDYGIFTYTIIKIILISLLLFVPSVFMGGTVPFLYRIVSSFNVNDRYLPYYYGLNTLGAMLGVVLSSYILFPLIGLENSAYLAGAVNLFVVFLLYFYHKKINEKKSWFSKINFLKKNNQAILSFKSISKSDYLYYSMSFLSGLFVFSLEIVWFNLLALIIGNSVYAFAIMLALVLVGIGAGSIIMSKIKVKNKLKVFGYTQLALTIYLFLSLSLWDNLGGIFTTVGYFDPSFWVMEITRFFTASTMLIIPCLLIGINFPLLMQSYEEIKKDAATTVGHLYALNSIGSATGLILGCFVFINIFGNKNSLNITATIPLLIFVIVLILQNNLKWKWILTIVFIVVIRFIIPTEWNILEMTGGQNIYFSQGNSKEDKILFHKESTYSGVITLIDKKGVKTLYTNGKFEGNNSTEILDQYLFAIIPGLFSENYDRAANLGLGVGGSLGAITQFPYKQIDLVEISPDIVKVARDHFSNINLKALDNKKVKINLEDGRIYFMKNKNKFDLISMEASSIWFAGSGNLYSKQFYDIVRTSLKKGGVFQQWIQLHHIAYKEIARIIKTFKSSFKYPTLWIMGHQAILVARKKSKITINYDKLLMLEKNSKIMNLLKQIGYKSIFQIFNHLILTSENIDKFVKDVENEEESSLQIHTDMFPILEFSTPKSNSSKDAFVNNRKKLFDYKWFDPIDIIYDIPTREKYLEIVKHFYFDTYDEFFH